MTDTLTDARTPAPEPLRAWCYGLRNFENGLFAGEGSVRGGNYDSDRSTTKYERDGFSPRQAAPDWRELRTRIRGPRRRQST